MSRYLRYDETVSTLFSGVLNLVRKQAGRRKLYMAAALQPLADRVLVKPIEQEEKTKSGIFLPDTAKEKPQEGEVLAVGPGKMSDDGKRIPLDIKVGDVVLYAKYGGTEIKLDGDDLMIL